MFNKLVMTTLIIMGGALLASPVFSAGQLIKIDSDPAVYYLDANNVRYLFPTESVYKTWYNDFSEVKTISLTEMYKYPLAENIKLRAGINLLSFTTDPDIYAVEPGGVIRPFDGQALIADIYGDNWRQRVINLPDGFYNDYIKGSRINSYVNAPNGFLSQDSSGQYYYKHKGLLWPLLDKSTVLKNNFNLTDAVKIDLPLAKRKRVINDFSDSIYSPTSDNQLNTADCENKKLKAAILFATRGNPQSSDVAKLATIKNRLEANFQWATKYLSVLDLDYPITFLNNDDELFYTDKRNGTLQVDNEVINTFYDNHPDEFDFIILYNNFILDEPQVANYLTVTNDMLGTGNANRHSAYIFGSGGKLKGVANMGNLNKYSIDNEENLNQAVNYILHELGHQWSARAIFDNDDGEANYALLDSPSHYHWQNYVDFISPLGGSGWLDNGDSTYTSKTALMSQPTKKPYADLDLYFMGLLPKPAIGPVKYFMPDSINEVRPNVIEGEIKEVTIDQIEASMGKLRCRLEK